jgi:hypothetical protein
VRGSGGNGTGSVGVRQSFHNSRLADARMDFRGVCGQGLWNQSKLKKCWCDWEFAKFERLTSTQRRGER